MEKRNKITLIVNENEMVKALRELADILEANPFELKSIIRETFWSKITEFKKDKVEWTEEKHEMLCKMYNEGTPHSEIAKFFNCSVCAVDSQLHKLGLNNSYTTMLSSPTYTKMRHGHPYSLDELEFIKNSFIEGMSLDEIAEKTHRTVKAIKFQLVKLNLIKGENNA